MVAGATLRLANSSLEFENHNTQAAYRVAYKTAGDRAGWVIEWCQGVMDQVGVLGGKVADEGWWQS